MPIITISRQFGCGGEYVAERVANALGYKYVSKELIEYIALLTGTDESTVHAFDEEEHSSMKASISKFMDMNMFKDMFSKNNDADLEMVEYIDEKKKLFNDQSQSDFAGFDSDAFAKMVERVLYYLVNEDNVIILGRGGQCILQNEQNAFHVRLYAPIDKRIEWVKNRDSVSKKEASAKVIEIDKRKAKFIKHYYNADIDDVNRYHMLVNLEKSSLDEVAGYITNGMKTKFNLS